MTGHRKFSELEGKLDANPNYPAVAERVAARLDAEDAAYEHSLRELRKALGMTQTQLANLLDTTQPTVSDIERRTDMFLSTLRSYVEALGGHLRVYAEFGETAVPIDTFRSIDNQSEPKAGAA
jgi:DNA-binding XRE family transcriptional regulator